MSRKVLFVSSAWCTALTGPFGSKHAIHSCMLGFYFVNSYIHLCAHINLKGQLCINKEEFNKLSPLLLLLVALSVSLSVCLSICLSNSQSSLSPGKPPQRLQYHHEG